VSVSEYCLATGDLTDPCNGGGDHWVMIDPTNGKLSLMSGVPELYSLTAPSGVSAALIDPNPSQENRWRITWSGKVPTYLENVNPAGLDGLPLPVIAISSNGQEIAYVDEQGHAFISDDKQNTAISAPEKVLGLIWGKTAWRVRANAK
jgi:hypothetical protein